MQLVRLAKAEKRGNKPGSLMGPSMAGPSGLGLGLHSGVLTHRALPFSQDTISWLQVLSLDKIGLLQQGANSVDPLLSCVLFHDLVLGFPSPFDIAMGTKLPRCHIGNPHKYREAEDAALRKALGNLNSRSIDAACKRFEWIRTIGIKAPDVNEAFFVPTRNGKVVCRVRHWHQDNKAATVLFTPAFRQEQCEAVCDGPNPLDDMAQLVLTALEEKLLPAGSTVLFQLPFINAVISETWNMWHWEEGLARPLTAAYALLVCLTDRCKYLT